MSNKKVTDIKQNIKNLEYKSSGIASDISKVRSVIRMLEGTGLTIEQYVDKLKKDRIEVESQIDKLYIDKENAEKELKNKVKSELNPKLNYEQYKTIRESGVNHQTSIKLLMLKPFGEVTKSGILAKAIIYIKGHTAYINRGESAYSSSELYIADVYFKTDSVGLIYSAKGGMMACSESKDIVVEGKTWKQSIKDNIEIIRKEFGYNKIDYKDFSKEHTIIL